MCLLYNVCSVLASILYGLRTAQGFPFAEVGRATNRYITRAVDLRQRSSCPSLNDDTQPSPAAVRHLPFPTASDDQQCRQRVR